MQWEWEYDLFSSSVMGLYLTVERMFLIYYKLYSKVIVFVLRYSLRASFPRSFPKPDRLNPPKGAATSVLL